MFIVYSKETGNIKNIVTGGVYKELKDLFPLDYIDYEKIYNTLNIEDNLFIINNFNFFKIINDKISLKQEFKDKLGV